MARKRKPRIWFTDKPGQAQVKVRLPEALRFSLEREASSHGHSMNTEIVRRLRESFLAQDEQTTLIAKTLLAGLDDFIVEKMVDMYMRDRAKEDMANALREEQQIEEGLK
jgi:Arc-like DNA binding domain